MTVNAWSTWWTRTYKYPLLLTSFVLRLLMLLSLLLFLSWIKSHIFPLLIYFVIYFFLITIVITYHGYKRSDENIDHLHTYTAEQSACNQTALLFTWSIRAPLRQPHKNGQAVETREADWCQRLSWAHETHDPAGILWHSISVWKRSTDRLRSGGGNRGGQDQTKDVATNKILIHRLFPPFKRKSPF